MTRPVLISPKYATPSVELLAQPDGAPPALDPIPTPLDLARVPVVLGVSLHATKGRGKASVDDADDDDAAAFADDDDRDRTALAELPVLAREWWQREYRVRDRYGHEHVITVEGHPSLGLPRAADQNVLIALATLIAENRERVQRGEPSKIVDGEFIAVTANDLLRAMGYDREKAGSRHRRLVRAALRRLSYVRLTYRADIIRNTQEHAAELRAKGPTEVTPLVPVLPARLQAWPSEEVTWLLDYKWRTDPRTGETWIQRLRLNPLFLDQLTSGWVAWVATGVYQSLTKHLARRLYVFLAGHAALRHELTRFDFSMAELVEGLALPLRREAGIYWKWLAPCVQELEAAGVLRGHHVERVRGNFTLRLDAGPALFLGYYLRGASLAQTHEDRVLYAFLTYCGFESAEAHALIAEQAEVVRSALLYTMYVLEQHPERFQKSIRGFVKDRVDHRRTNAGDVGYWRWYQRRIAREAPEATVAGTIEGGGPAAPVLADAPPPIERAVVIPRSSAATRFFEEALPRVERSSPMAAAFIDGLQAFDLVGDTLVLTSDGITAPTIEARVREQLLLALRDISEDRVIRLRIEPYDVRVHGLAVPAHESIVSRDE